MARWIVTMTDRTERTVEVPDSVAPFRREHIAMLRAEDLTGSHHVRAFGARPEGCSGLVNDRTHFGRYCPIHEET